MTPPQTEAATRVLNSLHIFIASMGGEICADDAFDRAMHHRRIDPPIARAGLRYMAKLGIVKIEDEHANKAHDAAGLRRTNEDKQRAVEAALRHPKAERMSNRLIAEHVGVSETMVTLQRKAICVNNADAPAIREVTRNGKTDAFHVLLP